jgi:hypothetical protein
MLYLLYKIRTYYLKKGLVLSVANVGKKEADWMWSRKPNNVPVANVIPYYTINLRINNQDILPERINAEVRERTDFCLSGI